MMAPSTIVAGRPEAVSRRAPKVSDGWPMQEFHGSLVGSDAGEPWGSRVVA